jgi:hypothetical protein
MTVSLGLAFRDKNIGWGYRLKLLQLTNAQKFSRAINQVEFDLETDISYRPSW